RGFFVDLDGHKLFLYFQSLLAVIMFSFGLNVGGIGRVFKIVPGLKSKRIKGRHILLLAILALSFFVVYRDLIVSSRSSYSNVAAGNYSDPVYALSKYILLLTFGVLGVSLATNGRIFIGSVLILVPLRFGWFGSDKNPILISFISTAVIISSKITNQRTAALLLFMSIPLSVFGLYVVFAFSYVRIGMNVWDALLLSFQTFTFVNLDPAGPYIS